MARGAPAARARTVSPACESSAICTFSTTVIEPKVAAIWKVRPTPSRQISRGGSPVMSARRAAMSPLSGASWPLIMLKQVDLPAPFGPISASNSPAPTAKLTPSTACTPPKDLRQLWTEQDAHGAASVSRRTQLRDGAGNARRERQHQQQDDGAEHARQYSVCAHDGVLQHGERRGADDRAGQRLQAAEQHHHQPVDRAADRDGLGRDRCPWRRRTAPPATPQKAPAMAKPIQCTRLTSMPIASARSGESRPARIA